MLASRVGKICKAVSYELWICVSWGRGGGGGGAFMSVSFYIFQKWLGLISRIGVCAAPIPTFSCCLQAAVPDTPDPASSQVPECPHPQGPRHRGPVLSRSSSTKAVHTLQEPRSHIHWAHGFASVELRTTMTGGFAWPTSS